MSNVKNSVQVEGVIDGNSLSQDIAVSRFDRLMVNAGTFILGVSAVVAHEVLPDGPEIDKPLAVLALGSFVVSRVQKAANKARYARLEQAAILDMNYSTLHGTQLQPWAEPVIQRMQNEGKFGQD